jgi:AhpC/TSA family
LQGRVAELQAKGLGLAAISYDSVETLAAFSRQRGITFPLLSDAGSETIKRYGILNTVVDEALGAHKDDPAVKEETQKYVSAVGVNPIMKGIAFPGTFIVDRKRRVTSDSLKTSTWSGTPFQAFWWGWNAWSIGGSHESFRRAP